MATMKSLVLVVLLIALTEAKWKHKRSPKPEDDHSSDKQKQPSWKPVDQPQEFTVMVDDNINKADQFRHETWKPGGVIEGEYAAPARDGKWLKVNYRADKEGFHILSQKVVSEAELNQPSGGSASDNQAKIETNVNGKDVKYTVKEDDLKKAKKGEQAHSGL